MFYKDFTTNTTSYKLLLFILAKIEAVKLIFVFM